MLRNVVLKKTSPPKITVLVRCTMSSLFGHLLALISFDLRFLCEQEELYFSSFGHRALFWWAPGSGKQNSFVTLVQLCVCFIGWRFRDLFLAHVHEALNL